MRVSSLSWAIASAMALVRSVSAAWIRRCLHAVAELHQAVGVQPAVRECPRSRAACDDRMRAGAQASTAGPGRAAGSTAPGTSNGRSWTAARNSSRAAARHSRRQRLFLVLEDHPVDALFGSLAGLAEADVDAGQRLQFQRDVFEDVGRVGALAQPLEEAAALADAAAVLDHRRQPAHQPLVEAGDLVGGPVFQLAQIDPSLDHRGIRPDVRATQRQHFTEFHVYVLSKTGTGGGLV